MKRSACIGKFQWACFSIESFAFVYFHIQEGCFCFGYFSRKSDCGVVIVCLLNELCYFPLSGCFPDRDNIIYIACQDEQFCSALVKNFSFNCRHEDIGESDCHFRTHGSAMKLQIVFLFKLERVLR